MVVQGCHFSNCIIGGTAQTRTEKVGPTRIFKCTRRLCVTGFPNQSRGKLVTRFLSYDHAIQTNKQHPNQVYNARKVSCSCVYSEHIQGVPKNMGIQ